MKTRSPIFIFIFFLVACASAPASATVTSSPVVTAIPPTETSTPTLAPLPTPTLSSVVITSGDWVQPYVALTFDLCQDPLYPAGYDAAIVEVLERYKVPATFFMGGDWMRTHPEETKALASNPNFELGNHSWSHPNFTELTKEQMSVEIEMTEDTLFQLTGRHSRLFRFPSGVYNDLSLQVVAEHGLHTIQWDSVTGDPDPAFDAPTILAEVQRTVRNGSIIIMHANGRGWHTAEALPAIIEYLQKTRGFTLLTVSKLVGFEPIQ
ncbi:MAG: polysaccharide deacetylase family protein [Anaerolineales bacterium]